MRLAEIRHGAPTDRPPLVIVHGLFGTARNWGVIAKRLSARREVVAVDLRNHGDSPRSPDNSYEALAADLGETIDRLGGRADLLGHSMGGKAAMVLALAEPALLRRLIVADIAPVAYGHSQLRYVEAMRSVDLAGITRRSEADARLAAAVEDPALRAFFLQSLAIGPEGAVWKLNLNALGDEMPRIMGFPDAPGRFEGPALFLTGAASDYVRPEHRAGILAHFPAAVFEEIPGAGHWLHAEAPRPFGDAVERFLEA
jgi:pimeloyl-ACP methyl ester carboxylesterase